VLIDSGFVDINGNCFSGTDIGTSNGVRISSDIPILVSTFGGANADSYPIPPSSDYDLYSVGTDDNYYAGPSGTDIIVYEANGAIATQSLGATEATGADNNNGQDGLAPGFRLSPSAPIGAISQAD
jgi:hypothetical protein